MANPKIDDVVRARFMGIVLAALTEADLEVLQVGSNEVTIPWVEGEEEGYLNLTFRVPKGQRGGDGYDGHAEAAFYEEELTRKAEEAELKRIAKEKKIAKDTARRAKEKGEG